MLGWLMVAPVLGLMSACSSAIGASSDTSTAQSQTASAKKPGVTAAADTSTAFKIGTNLNTINWWDGSRPFMNMIYGTGWAMQSTNPWGSYQDIPQSSLDANGWVKSVPAGYRVARGLSVPASGGDFVCRYQGNGTLAVTGPVSNVSTAPGITRFTVATTYPDPQLISLYYYVDPTNYIRNIDCREASASTTALLAPEFATPLSGFKVIRFMKWQIATENNQPVTWATRNKPGDGEYSRNDGVPIEVMVQAANELNADPWFTVPWNADADYVTRFATYVRDNLAPGHVAYVETSNEVWNPAYPVFGQAKAEAIAEGLPSAENGAPVTNNSGERYAEKSRQVMQIWSTVFAGQMNRLVRVAAFQHVSPYWSNLLLKYQNLYQSVDAVATAPYFGYDITDGMTLDQVMGALPGKIDETLYFARQQKTIAQSYGLRYITYEAGQHVILPNNLSLLQQIERDPRMYGLYKQFMGAWQTQIGDSLNLFALTGPISRYGAWGVVEYNGQSVSNAPKMQAIQEFLGTAPATTQVCPDGSVIPLTSTCPTTTTPPSKRKTGGGGKGGGKNGTAVS